MVYSEQLYYEYNGKKYKVNAALVAQKNLSADTVEKIKELHIKRLRLKEMLLHTDRPEFLYEIASEITEVEYQLQDLWGFDRDCSRHKFWELPKCLCPKLDNQDAIGHPGSVSFLSSCPLHCVQPHKKVKVVEDNLWRSFTDTISNFFK